MNVNIWIRKRARVYINYLIYYPYSLSSNDNHLNFCIKILKPLNEISIRFRLISNMKKSYI